MQISPAIALTILTLLVSLLILVVSAWNLYLSHYKEPRSDIELLPEEREKLPGFQGGNGAIDDSAFWNTIVYLKVVNSGDKSAYVRDINHSLHAFKKDGEVAAPERAEIDTKPSSDSWVGKEIEPHSSQRCRASLQIQPEKNIGVLIDHEIAVIRHTIVVEDNKGSYEVSQDSEVRLVGPDSAHENWDRHQEQNAL